MLMSANIATTFCSLVLNFVLLYIENSIVTNVQHFLIAFIFANSRNNYMVYIVCIESQNSQ